MDTVKHTDVLVIGAGPSGLMMAAQLLRYGIQPKIVDAKRGPDRETKANLVHARSMELFRQLGLSDQLFAKGSSFYAIQLYGLEGLISTLDFSQLAATDIAFPFIQGVGQDDIERLLLDRLTENACPVAWETCVESLRLDDGGATATLVHDGKRQDWRCAWVVGADGKHSTLRRLLGIPLEGADCVRRFFVADVETERVDSRKIRLFLPDGEPWITIPLGVSNRFRILGLLPKVYDSAAQDEQLHSVIKQATATAFGGSIIEYKCLWVSTFSYRRQSAEQLRQQRCFLIGDAAHRLSPLVWRSMNEGLYDAANLAWKLAGVVNGRMAQSVLHTYQQERMPAIKADSHIFGIGKKKRLWPGWLERARMVKRMRRIANSPDLLRRTFDRLSGLDVTHRQSSLSVHHASGRAIQAGDRLPCLSVFDEKSKTQTDLHRWCEKPGFVLLVLGTIGRHHLNIIGQWMRQKYPREMHLYYLPYSVRNHGVFEVFEVKPNGTKIVLIRPDMYIGYINDMLHVSLIDTYMEEIVGWSFFNHLPEKG